MVSYTDLQPVNCKIDINPFLHGFARLFDFLQVLDKPGRKTPYDVDRLSLASDWEAIGDDMRKAIEQVRTELGLEQEQ